ncbi:MAG: two-component system, OmpR family, phosphate regulon sensor histidine kinase PhoR [Solirubrobacterales bacterium]|nr:two-component system, OmpR family, phosphate regulon sensor histidine kinase PhoR [Solirubrobacterales bacterium]
MGGVGGVADNRHWMAPSRRSTPRSVRRRPFGVRLYLALAFAAVAMITAGLAYVLVSDTGVQAADEDLVQLAVGRTVGLADEIGARPQRAARTTLAGISEQGYSAWVFEDHGRLVTADTSGGVDLLSVPGGRQGVRSALIGSRYVDSLPGGVTVVAVPIFRDGAIDGAILGRSVRAPEVQHALEALRGDRLTALGVAVAVAVLISFLVASAITSRVKRLAESAARISEGELDEPLEGAGGRDEITDLGRALERMRGALRQTFTALREERDRLSAIFEALSDAVMVVQADGEVRFFNASARELIRADGRAIDPLIPWLRRAASRAVVESDALRVGDRVYSLNARQLPAEDAVLAVVRDRTEEMRREVAEREFVSNAAHELRNPIAGISGAIEVLRAGAKDDPEAREHFLVRLSEDAERISRLTESLLILARMEAVGEGGVEALDVALVIEEATEAVAAPDGIEVELQIGGDLVAQGDRVLLRQVVIGLLTNAFKNTPAPGRVTIRARRGRSEELDGGGEVWIEVTDTGSGIAAAEIDRIFERFYRGSGSLEQEGFGLGLSIARRMVDVMGGEIGVESAEGEGATFWVRLRAAQPATTPVA